MEYKRKILAWSGIRTRASSITRRRLKVESRINDGPGEKFCLNWTTQDLPNCNARILDSDPDPGKNFLLDTIFLMLKANRNAKNSLITNNFQVTYT